ncbi:hypothetical protein OG782_01195 [Streptomyces sp. NBC_00876]|uniref:hypothetical protein n=1 Tax=Streptomyces sp. NBC_00876 TaxID=2975853 RepID=UPI0038696AB9|nr:hypothetical protein OG782_01195 [Streptomyces sp. NBC_00876]
MTPHDMLALLVVATAVRVFAPDLRSLSRRALGAGVRAGATALMEDHRRRSAYPAQVVVDADSTEEAQR